MSFRRLAAWVGLALMLGGVAVLPHRAFGQDGGGEGTGRKIVSRVNPNYPAMAMQMGIQGHVKILATVAPDGRVVATKLVGGAPMFVEAATDAVKKWRFEPGPKETVELVEFAFHP